MLTTTRGAGLFGPARRLMPRWVVNLRSVLFIGVGVALLIGGTHRYDAVQPIAGGKTATGTVVAVNSGRNCERHGCTTYWVPTIQFTANGRDFTFTGPESGNPMNTGDHVQVSYDPGNPAFARDISAGSGEGWILIGLGALAILVGSASFLLRFRRRNRMR